MQKKNTRLFNVRLEDAHQFSGNFSYYLEQVVSLQANFFCILSNVISTHSENSQQLSMFKPFFEDFISEDSSNDAGSRTSVS